MNMIQSHSARLFLTALGSCALLVAVFLLASGPAIILRQFGSADLGDIDFRIVQRRTSPNDALVCKADFCSATADFAAPDFELGADSLFTLFRHAIDDEPRLERVDTNVAEQTLRYVQRSRWMGFPDTINVKIFPLPGGRSTIALYSRSQLGKGDFGVNRTRLTRWINLLTIAAQK